MNSDSNTTPKPWPSREEWAIEIRTYLPDFSVPVSKRLQGYATKDEVTNATAEIRDKVRTLDAQARKAKQDIGDLAPRKGETPRQYTDRIWAMTPEENTRRCVWDQLRRQSGYMREALKALNAGTLPQRCDGLKAHEFCERYARAVAAYHEAKRQLCAERPIDDVEWERELQRRRELDERFGR